MAVQPEQKQIKEKTVEIERDRIDISRSVTPIFGDIAGRSRRFFPGLVRIEYNLRLKGGEEQQLQPSE